MEFSFTLHRYLVDFINSDGAGVLLIAMCCFGIALLLAVIAMLTYPLRHFKTLYYMIILPPFLTWLPSCFVAAILFALDIEVIKTLTVIAAMYLLILSYCLVNMNLLMQYLNSFGEDPENE